MVKAYLFTENDSLSHLVVDLLNKKGIRSYTLSLHNISGVTEELNYFDWVIGRDYI